MFKVVFMSFNEVIFFKFVMFKVFLLLVGDKFSFNWVVVVFIKMVLFDRVDVDWWVDIWVGGSGDVIGVRVLFKLDLKVGVYVFVWCFLFDDGYVVIG